MTCVSLHRAAVVYLESLGVALSIRVGSVMKGDAVGNPGSALLCVQPSSSFTPVRFLGFFTK